MGPGKTGNRRKHNFYPEWDLTRRIPFYTRGRWGFGGKGKGEQGRFFGAGLSRRAQLLCGNEEMRNGPKGTWGDGEGCGGRESGRSSLSLVGMGKGTEAASKSLGRKYRNYRWGTSPIQAWSRERVGGGSTCMGKHLPGGVLGSAGLQQEGPAGQHPREFCEGSIGLPGLLQGSATCCGV